jgi:tetratricopeptide (TPR) repeat protein
MGDWYRKTSWSAADSDDFERRLARARRESRAQYLRIQAACLFQTGAKELVTAAATLATRVTDEYKDLIQTGQAHQLLGQCYEASGDIAAAIAEFRKAVDWERQMPFVQTDAYLDFAWLVARHGAVDHFPETLELLTRFCERPVFPIQRYRYHGALALIAHARAEIEVARTAARAALDASRETSSPFRFHRRLGLFKPRPDDMHSQLQRLAK